MSDLLLSQRNSEIKDDCPNSLLPSEFNSGLVLPVTVLDHSLQSNHHYISKADKPKNITALQACTTSKVKLSGVLAQQGLVRDWILAWRNSMHVAEVSCDIFGPHKGKNVAWSKDFGDAWPRIK